MEAAILIAVGLGYLAGLFPAIKGLGRLQQRRRGAHQLLRLLQRLPARRAVGIEDLREGQTVLTAGLCRTSGQEPLLTPISGLSALAYRVVGIHHDRAARRRHKLIDMTFAREIELVLPDGLSVSLRADAAGLLGWPPVRRKGALVARAPEHRQILQRSGELTGSAEMVWSEWALLPGEHVLVIGRCDRTPEIEGAQGTYRAPPTAWTLGPLEGLPLLLWSGEPARTASGLARNQLDYPEWLAPYA